MNRKMAVPAIAAIALVAVALFFFLGGQRMLFGGPRGQFGDPGDFNAGDRHGGPFGNPGDFNAGFPNFNGVKESLGLPVDASNADVLAALGLPADASPQQVMDALIQMGIQPTGGMK